MPMTAADQPKLGLRERKKLKTRAAIQQHAMRLFREQGYHATTTEQIAEAAEISPSTLFRYFATKEALVLEDDYDPLLVQAFRDQPPELSPMQALRAAVRLGFSVIPQEEQDALRERMQLAMSVPEIRAASMQQINNTLDMIAELLAIRLGCAADDLQVLTFAGAVVGTFMSVQTYIVRHPEANFITVFDEALAVLEAGLPMTMPPQKPQG